jgi:hypothetical protein
MVATIKLDESVYPNRVIQDQGPAEILPDSANLQSSAVQVLYGLYPFPACEKGSLGINVHNWDCGAALVREHAQGLTFWRNSRENV